MSTPASVEAFPTRGWSDIANSVDKALQEQSGLVGVAVISVDHFAELSRRAADHSSITALVTAITTRLGEQLADQSHPAILTAEVDDGTFVIIRHPLHGPAEMEGIGLRAVESFMNPLTVDGQHHDCTISVGVATSARDDTAQALLVYARYALDDAETLGRNRMVAFDDEDRELLNDVSSQVS